MLSQTIFITILISIIAIIVITAIIIITIATTAIITITLPDNASTFLPLPYDLPLAPSIFICSLGLLLVGNVPEQ